ncbi:MAG: indolepyruvate oxidoreductase subunit beta [Clostridia bacterium]|nr:indolepyruvate oxidoreductase subunit beta [Clostridia bacterium]MBR3838928.1 indolepyruvate oxidoreductase subunit beta [Clostridia bacterium]
MVNLNILIVGVGGQGTLLASKFLGAVAALIGKDVKVSEVHGMSQRGGSVVTCVKIGDNIHSPLIDEGQADIILAFEQLEAVRWIKYLKKGGTVITNIQKINPMPVVFGQTTYPDKILDILADSDVTLHALDAFSLAVESGTSKAVNIVLLGVLSRTLPEIPENIWQDGLNAVIPAKLLDVNTRAFEKGRNYIEG